jgi:hypothetical protein
MGVVMTDIAFSPSGNLFGISFGTLYSINSTTGASAFIGNHAVPDGNALVFGADGTLYSAGNTATSLYTIDPTSGATTDLGNMGFASGGDLAFLAGDLYLASTGTPTLVNINLSNLALSFAVGPFGVVDVFGLATENLLYGVAGTQIFTVNASTGAATGPVDFSGQGLGDAFGQAFQIEAIPEPSTALLLGMGLVVMGGARRRCLG